MSIPQIRTEAIEAVGRKILMEYDPSLLSGQPCPVPIETIIETKFDLILEFHTLRKNPKILGETIFDDGAVVLYDQIQRQYRMIAVRAGTILTALGLNSDAAFHRSKLILKIYRDVVWVLSERAEELQETAWIMGEQDIESGLCYLENFAPDIELQAFEEKVCCLVQNQMLVNIIDRALLRLKRYPDRGELYYEILTKQFIYRFNSTEKELLEELNIERSVFYDRKREAIYLFSVCLFGYSIPEVLEELPRLNSD